MRVHVVSIKFSVSIILIFSHAQWSRGTQQTLLCFGRAPVTILVVWACSSHRSTHVWNLIDKLSATNEQHLNWFGTVGLIFTGSTALCDTGAATDL